MKDTIVAKFGGSSLADTHQFEKVKNIVENNSQRKYIIPSAPGKRHPKDYKITDLLYLCSTHVQQGISFDDVFKIISDRYNEIIVGLSKKYDYMSDLDINKYLLEIKKDIVNGISTDYTASRGEYLNAIILANLLHYSFIDAKELIFFDKYGKLNTEYTQKCIIKRLSNVKNAVIPGFLYGSDHLGNIKTFSRGGSDITGALIARGTDATLYENWTDVSGFLMADRRIIKNPMPIETITYRELRELSYMGATVLHEDSVFPVREAEIPINIKKDQFSQ